MNMHGKVNLHLIRASAGSGKTHTLTERISEVLLTDDGMSPEGLIATTFTKKAAAELTERLRKRLLEEGRPDVAEQLDAALIGTVNSVSGSIVTQYAIDQGLSPNLQVLDEEGAKTFFDAALGQIAAKVESEQWPLLERVGYLGDSTGGGRTQRRKSTDWKDKVRSLAQVARANNITAEELITLAQPSWDDFETALPTASKLDKRDNWRERLRDVANKLEAKIPSLASRSQPPALRAVSAMRELAEQQAQKTTAQWSIWTDIAGLKEPAADGAPAKKELADFSDDLKVELLQNPAHRRDLQELLHLIFEAAANVLDTYQEAKRAAGVMDFTDQEVLALELLESNERVRQSFASRYRLLAVDEFQDTSPIQLALFMRIGELVDQVIWVGDLKQSIYAFRDADPSLMEAVERKLESQPEQAGASRRPVTTLSCSHRSNEPVLSLSNNLFVRAFESYDPATVHLSVADRRKVVGDYKSGDVEIWDVKGSKAKQVAESIAAGVKDLMKRKRVEAGNVAVLVRTKDRASSVSSELKAVGINASSATVPAVQTPGGRMVVAAMSLAVNPSDRLALMTLVQSLPEHPASDDWFTQLAHCQSEALSEKFTRWRNDVSLMGVMELADRVGALTPRQLVESVIGALQMPRRVATWTDSVGHQLVLDTLVGMADEYMSQLPEADGAYTPQGFMEFVRDWEGTVERADDRSSVFVDTIHKAKGLEWPVTVIGLQNPKDRVTVSGAFAFNNGPVEVEDPLGNREVRWLPDLFPANRTIPEWAFDLQEDLSKIPFVAAKQQQEKEEELRLHYVALTRSRTTTVIYEHAALSKNVDRIKRMLSLPMFVTSSGKPLLDTPSNDLSYGLAKIRFRTKAENYQVGSLSSESADDSDCSKGEGILWSMADEIDVEFREYEPGRTASDLGSREAKVDALGFHPVSYPAARMQASAMPSKGPSRITQLATLGRRLTTKGNDERSAVGNAVHAFLAVPPNVSERESVAKEVLNRWLGDRSNDLTAADLVQVADRWFTWIANQWPDAAVTFEVPFSWSNGENQVSEGFIDTLIEVGDQVIIVEHKTYPGMDPVGHIRKNYLGQLGLYRKAVAALTGKDVTVLVHMPFLGTVYRVEAEAC